MDLNPRGNLMVRSLPNHSIQPNVIRSGRKLMVAGAVVVVTIGYMAYVGASSSWQYYMTADECLANAAQASGHRVRVSGMIAAGSLQIAGDAGQASFLLCGTAAHLPVICTGPLPDDLAGSMEVVVEGRLESAPCLLRGDKILTRCASKYESRRVPAAAIDTSPARERGT
jgi:cytochrome c-type biogenesis protein CcmE